MRSSRVKSALFRVVSCAVALGVFLAARAALAQELSKLPYVPTPQIVVDEMLRLAGVTAKDFLIDLGSGDGRVILTAARKFKARGLGVDIDKNLVALSNKQAKIDGLEDRAKFIEQDMFKADISKATVVTLYVVPDFMEKLRPKLVSELQPGARIVAHDYYMSGWYPDKRLELTVPEKMAANGTDKAYLYLWIVPSIVAGTWRVEFDAGGSQRQLIILGINQQYQVIGVSAENALGPVKIENASLHGNNISFTAFLATSSYKFTGTITDRAMAGTAVSSNDAKPVIWKASKLPPEK